MYLKFDDISDPIDYVLKIVLQEARKEDRLTNQLLITMLSAYSNNPINLLINAPSGVGKNYVINKVSALFPQSDILSLAGMTEKALFHRSGTLVRKNEETAGEYEPIEEKLTLLENDIEEVENEISQTRDKNQKYELKNTLLQLKEERKELLKDTKKLIDLSNKIIIFLDTPPEKLLAGLLPLLSHDKYEVEYEYVDTHNGIKTRNNVLRGWSAVICAQALDYSHSARFPEYQRRFITTNPTMTQEKYNEAINLISDKFSNPDIIYQHNIVSDQEKNKAREIVKGLKQIIQEICSDVEPGKNNVIIPFSELILQSLPREKSEDMTRANRLYTYLSFLPIVNFDERPRLSIVKQGDTRIQTIPIATFDDLKKTIQLMEYSDGVRPYILEWYYDVFNKAYKDKEDTPDTKVITITSSNKGKEETLVEEKRTAVTSQNLIDKHKASQGENLTSQKLLQSYLYPLLNHGYIDKIDSVLDRRAKIYFPIIETKKYINLFYSGEKNNLSQQSDKIVVNSTTFPSPVYILTQIEPILKYYSEKGYYTKLKNNLNEEITIDELIDQYFGNSDDYFTIVEQKQEPPLNAAGVAAAAAEVKGWNSVPTSETSTPTIQQEKEEVK